MTRRLSLFLLGFSIGFTAVFFAPFPLPLA
jgi:hypothetical protein